MDGGTSRRPTGAAVVCRSGIILGQASSRPCRRPWARALPKKIRKLLSAANTVLVALPPVCVTYREKPPVSAFYADHACHGPASRHEKHRHQAQHDAAGASPACRREAWLAAATSTLAMMAIYHQACADTGGRKHQPRAFVLFDEQQLGGVLYGRKRCSCMTVSHV